MAKYYGYTSDGLEEVYRTKAQATRAVCYAFNGECGDCGFKSNKEVLEHYPVYKIEFNKPVDWDKKGLDWRFKAFVK